MFNKIKNIFFSVLPFFFVAGLGYIYNNFIGIAFLLFSFLLLRYSYKYRITFHLYDMAKCFLLTCLMFTICGLPLIIFNMNISLLLSIPIGIFMTYILYKKQLSINFINSIKYKQFNLKTCTEIELREQCRIKGFSEEKTQKVIEHIILKLSYKDMADKYKVTEKAIEIARYRIKKELDNKL